MMKHARFSSQDGRSDQENGSYVPCNFCPHSGIQEATYQKMFCRGGFMDQTTDYYLHCGLSQPKSDQICCICGGALETQIEEYALPPQPPHPASSRRRRLIVSLVLGGVGLASIGICASTLKGLGLLNAILIMPHKLPVDTHRILSLPLENLGEFTWLPDNTHVLGYNYFSLFLLDGKSGKIVWEQKTSFNPAGRHGKIL